MKIPPKAFADPCLSIYLIDVYQKFIGGVPYQQWCNNPSMTLHDLYKDVHLSGKRPLSEINRFLIDHAYLFPLIQRRAGADNLFGLPAVLLAYFLSWDHPRETWLKLPLDKSDLELIYADLGINIPKPLVIF